MNNSRNEVKKVNISELAHMSTLSAEEAAELEAEEAGAEGAAAADALETEEGQGGVHAADYAQHMASKEAVPAKKRIEHTEPVFTAKARPDRKTMFDFMFYHSYCNVMGVLSVLIGCASIGMFVYSIVTHTDTLQILLFGAVMVMFLSNSPFTLWFRAKKQSDLICDEKNTITYTFSDAGFDMSRGQDEYAGYEWTNMYKVKEAENGFYMYIERNRAFVVPKCDLNCDLREFRALLKGHVAKRLKLMEEA